MRKWQNLAPPDDPGSWYDISGFWPTTRFTYESVEFPTATNLTATGTGNVTYAFVGRTLTATREFVIAGNIWEYSAGTLTDRTNGVTVGSAAMMANYGAITICVMGRSTATVSSSSTTFSALAGAPMGEIVLVQSNAVLIFNTDTSQDGWAASDVGDYTNWTTGEAASGRLIATPGPITAAIPWGNDVLVFKANAIYRMWYVGGLVKWQTQLLHTGIGIPAGSSPHFGKYALAAGNRGVLFWGLASSAAFGFGVYMFDGSSFPVRVNPLTSGMTTSRISYDPWNDLYCLCASPAIGAWFYNATSDAWGYAAGVAGTGSDTAAALSGDFAARAEVSPMPVVYLKTDGVANQLKRYAPTGTRGVGTMYVQTAKAGRPDRKTLFSRFTPRLTRRTDVGTQSNTLTIDLYRELHDTSAAKTVSGIAESPYRARFDFQHTDNFARFKHTFVDYDVELGDPIIGMKDAGEN